MRPLPRLALKAAAIAAASCAPLAQAFLRAPTVPDWPPSVDLDGSAFTSLAYRLEGNSLSGREFAHTYGPLAQALTHAAARCQVAGDFVSSLPLIQLAFWTLNVALVALLVLVVPSLDWKRSTLVVLLLAHFEIPAHYPSFRALAAMIAVAVAAHACAVRGRRLKWALAVLAAGLCVTAQLLTVEAGAYAIAAAVGMPLLAAAFSGRGSPAARGERRSGDLEALCVLVGTWAVLQVLVAAALSATARPPAGLLDYPRGALRIAHGYALTMGRPWDFPAGATLGLAAATVLVLGMAAWRGYWSDGLDRRLLWGWTLLALAQMKGAFTRSDIGHICLGFTPIVVLCALLLGGAQKRLPSLPWWLAFAALLFAWPAQGLIWRELVRIATDRVSLASRWQEARRFRIAEERLLPTELLRSLPRAREPLLVIPYQNHLAAAMERPLVGGVHQAYSAYTVPLQRELVEAARRAGPGLGVIVVKDGPESPALDGVHTISRLPYVFEYLLETFALRAPDLVVDHGAFALERRPSPRVLPRRPLEFRLGQKREEGVAVRLAAPARCPLVELRLRIRYPWWLWLGRPAPLVARFSSESGPLARRRLVPLLPRGEFTTLVSLVPADEVPRLFSDDPPAGESWERLEIFAERSDHLGIAPSALEVRELSCLLR